MAYSCFCKRRELSELDGLAASLRDRAFLGELVMDQLGLGIVDKTSVVVRLHFRGQIVPRGVHGRGLDREQLNEIKFKHHNIICRACCGNCILPLDKCLLRKE